jgi:hypothetical protein
MFPKEVRELRSIGKKMRSAVSSGEVLGYLRLNQQLHRRVREISGQHTAAGVLERLARRASGISSDSPCIRDVLRCRCRNTWPSSMRSVPVIPGRQKRPHLLTCAASSRRCTRSTGLAPPEGPCSTTARCGGHVSHPHLAVGRDTQQV